MDSAYARSRARALRAIRTNELEHKYRRPKTPLSTLRVRYVETAFTSFGLRAEGFQFTDKLGAFFSGKKLFDISVLGCLPQEHSFPTIPRYFTIDPI